MTNERLVLVPLNDLKDQLGNLYPEEGVVECDFFSSEKTFHYGLCGILWGIYSNLVWIDGYNDFVVVNTTHNHEFIIVNQFPKIAKFRRGEVVQKGNLHQCFTYIKAFIIEYKIDIDHEKIAGNIKESDGNHLILDGYKSKAISTQALTHSIVTGEESDAITLDIESHAFAMGKNSRAVATKDHSHAIAFNVGSRSRSCGKDSIALCLGLDGTAINSGNEGITFNKSETGCFAVGKNGIAIITYYEGDKRRIKVFYEGEDIEANVIYSFEDGQITQVAV